MYMSSPVLARGTLFGHSSKRKGQFVAMDPDTGKILWATEGRNATSASVVAAGNHLVFLTTESQMIIAPVDAAAFREVRRYTVAPSAIYAQPVVLNDRVIVRRCVERDRVVAPVTRLFCPQRDDRIHAQGSPIDNVVDGAVLDRWARSTGVNRRGAQRCRRSTPRNRRMTRSAFSSSAIA